MRMWSFGHKTWQIVKFPKTAETYVHRSGRSARAGASGEAVVLLGQADNVSYKKVMNNLNKGDLTAWDANQPSRMIYGEWWSVLTTWGWLYLMTRSTLACSQNRQNVAREEKRNGGEELVQGKQCWHLTRVRGNAEYALTTVAKNNGQWTFFLYLAITLKWANKRLVYCKHKTRVHYTAK